MAQSNPSQITSKTAKLFFDSTDDTTLNYNIKEENTLNLEIRRKKLQSSLPVEKLEDIKGKMGLEEANLELKKPEFRLTFEDGHRNEFQTQYFLNKRISYLINPQTLASLDVDIRSLGGLKFFGFRPTVTKQIDGKTKLRAGFSVMPGSVCIILGASRALSEHVTFAWQLEQSVRDEVSNSSSLQLELEFWNKGN